MTTLKADRNEFIDFLRFVGLALIILAHVEPPTIIQQVRSFDVPLMVLISAMSFALSYKEGRSYLSYLWSRIKRLVFPVWIFLSALFFGIFLFDSMSSKLDFVTIRDSYLLLEGIGYVWIIRVFLMVALTAPLLYRIHIHISNHLQYLGTLLALYVTYEVCLFYSLPYINSGLGQKISLVTHYLVPYSLIFALGLRIPDLSTRINLSIMVSAAIIYAALAIILFYDNGYIVTTWQYKYPPSAYYFSFALSGSLFCWIFGSYIWQIIQRFKRFKTILLFIAQNSLWIYLWHIPIVDFLKMHFVIEYIIVFLGAVSLTYVQVYIVQNIILPHIQTKRWQNNIISVFTG